MNNTFKTVVLSALIVILFFVAEIGYTVFIVDRAHECGYNDGHSDGYEDGYEFGYNDGYEDGYEFGYNDGYEDGYDDGANDILNQLYYSSNT